MSQRKLRASTKAVTMWLERRGRSEADLLEFAPQGISGQSIDNAS